MKSRTRGLFSRAFFVVLIVGTVLAGMPVGEPFSNGRWPGAAAAWNWLGSLISDPGSSADTPADAAAGTREPPRPDLGPAAPRTVAVPAKRVREVPELADPSTQVFAMSDGSFQAEVSAEPRRYRDPSGAWRDIDPSVREEPGKSPGGFRFVSDHNNFVARFGDRTDRLARFEYAGGAIEIGIAGQSRAVTPRVDGATVTYPGVVGGADLEYTVTAEGVKENIVLAGPVADPAFRFTLRTEGVSARIQGDGSIGFFSKATPDGPPVFAFPRPFMTDNDPDGKSIGKVTQTLERRGSAVTVTVRADKKWLAAAGRAFPVRVDPTIRIEPTPTTGKDAQIWSDTPDRADGGLYPLSVGTDSSGRARSLVQFDTSVVPAGTALTSATLRLYYDNDLYTGANNVTMETRQVTAPWDEATVTWNKINAAMGAAGLSTVVKQANVANVWHEWDIRNIAQSWVSQPTTNYGVMVKATDETLGRGGAIYQAAEYSYGREWSNRPKLVLSWGSRPSVDLRQPDTITSTGAVLSWPAYADPNPADPNDDVVELQVHRTVFQTFTPSRSTLLAPLPPTATSFTDTTATPTPVDSTEPYGDAYYYMVAAKTRDGQLIPGPTQLARLPKAGLITRRFTGSAADTTIASNTPNTNLDSVDGQPWLMVGNNSTTYGNTRAIVRFDGLNTGLPAGARIVDADFTMWGFYSEGSGATFDAHALSKPFVENQATWARASTATAWSAAGGDFGPRLDQVVGITNDPKLHTWENAAVVQGWVDNPATNNGYLVKIRDEAGTAKQRVLLLSGEAPEPQLRPSLLVTYTAPTAELTYYAPDTPTVRMVSDEQRTVPVTITNTTTSTWRAADYVLSQRWTLPDGTDITGGNRIDTALPSDIAPGQMVTVQAGVKTSKQGTENNLREAQVISWDLRNPVTGAWLSTSGGPPALPQNVSVEEATSDQLGLEKFYAYAGTATGAGSNVLVNQYAGNVVFSYDAFSNPGRGLNTFLRLTYNSLDTVTTTSGYGWSLAAAGVVRLGASLELHPKGQDYPTRVTLPDGDGTSHVFTLDKHGSTDPAAWTYVSPHGVHLYLQRAGGSDTSRRWVMTGPDRTEFWFDDEGWLTATRDRNGNEQTFTYTQRKSNNQPRKFLAYVTDPVGRKTLTLDYYTKDDTNNPFIIDQVKSIKDISGRTLTFAYSDKGLLTDVVDGAGSAQPKPFHFDYDATQGNKNVKLVRVTDPRGNHTDLAYYTAPVDPQDKWKVHTITDRRGNTTTFAYSDPDGPQGGERDSTVTDAENHTTRYHMDNAGRPVSSTNANNETTTLTWDGDHNVTSLTENNGAVTTWRYDQKTGYPLEIRDAEAVANNTPATVLGYQYGLDGHTAELTSKTSPEGRQWAFSYDTHGNLTHITDPKGVATPTVGDYQTVYTYDPYGQLLTATDANDNVTTFDAYDPTGFPRTTVDALNHPATMVFDVRGNPTSVTDANGKTTTAGYDTYGRPGETRVPRDQAASDYITTPAPVYDRNDNVEQATAPNGATTTAVYDPMDQPATITAPKDTPTGPDRTSAFTYDKVGNLLTQTQPLGVATPTDPNDYVTHYTYDPIYQLTDTVDAAGHKTTWRYNNVGDVTTVIDPRKNATPNPDDYTTKISYDRNHRQRTATDADGNVVSVDYDRDNNVVTQTDAEHNTTTLVYDERSTLIEARVPHKTGVTRVTQFVYDEVGNRTKTITPRGVETTDDPNDFVAETVYDKLNRPVEQRTPFDRDDPEIKTADTTIYTYDPVGNLTEVSAPPSAGQTVRNISRYTYYDNGWTRTSTDPWGIATSYQYNPLGQQTLRTLTSAGGSTDRTMTWDYYPDGKLKSRGDTGVPVGRPEVLVDNSDTPRVSFSRGTATRDTAGTGFQGYDYHRAPEGTFTWNPVVPADGTYEVFVRYPDAPNGAQFANYTVWDGATLRAAKGVDQTQGGGTWVSLGRAQLTAGTSTTIKLQDGARAGDLLADSVKLVRDTTEPDTETKGFTYSYDPNANLTTIADTSTGALVDNYQLTYNGLNQVTKVEEKLAATIKNTTLYAYNENGAITTLDHDRQDSVFDYNTRDLLERVTNTETGATPKITTYTYTPRGQIDLETKPNANTVDYDYHLDGALAAQTEKKTDGTLVSQHQIDYTANGNRATDHTKLQNADDHTNYLDHTYAYTYDPRERLTGVQKKNPNGSIAETETYRHDANNNVIDQTVDNTQTSYTYDRNRLVTTTSNGTTAAYNYDPFGRLDTVTTGAQIIEQYIYDGFDRTTTHRKRDPNNNLITTTYTYDPLDRTTATTDNPDTPNAKTTTYSYLGLTNQLVDEQIAGQTQRTYQYDAYGQRLTQSTKDTDGPGPQIAEDNYYGYNPHTDVETLTTNTGDTKTTYGYTAYGNNDTQAFTGIDKPDTQQPGKQPFNYYRYTGKRYDPTSGTYDMGFRDYQPAINRFTVRDTYNGALADLNLTTNPWTSNPYSLASGNPITGIELDGHCSRDGGILVGCGAVADRSAREQQVAQAPTPSREPVKEKIGHTTVRADNWDIYGAAYLSAMQKFDDRRDGSNADQREMLRNCIEANKLCMGSGWLDVHEFLDYMCEYPGMNCPGDRGSGLGDGLAAAAESGMVMGGGGDGGLWGRLPRSAEGRLVQVSKPDSNADLLAERIGGRSRVMFENDTQHREFDVISDQYIGQTKPGGMTLNSAFRNQAKATFEWAVSTGRVPYFHFDGAPGPGVIETIHRYEGKYGITAVIDLVPFA